MAKQTVNIGTNANDGTGDPLRSAFDKLNDNFDEVYADSFVTTDRINADAVTGDKIGDDEIDSEHLAEGAIDEEHLNASNSPTDNYILSYDSGSGGFTWVEQFDGDITSIVAGDGLTGSSLETDEATLNVVGGDGITASADEIEATVDDSTIELSASDGSGALRVKDDGITHDKLEDRYTARASAVTTSGDTELDWSSAAIFPVTMGGDHTLNFSNYKKGQVVDIIVSGEHTITLGTETGTPTINQVGDGTYDNTTTNLIQVVCTDDDSTPEFFYSVGTYSSDTNPA